MFDRIVSTKTMDITKTALDAVLLRHRVIANNLANVDTPGYKRSEVVFESELRKAMGESGGLGAALTDEGHTPFGKKPFETIVPRVVQSGALAIRPDGNNVDIDREMADLAKNSIKYEMLVQQMSNEIKTIRSAIDGRI